MTKRPNSFEENYPLQQKMHIGTKEVDCGVDTTRMQQVYDRTRMLLYEGVHRNHSAARLPAVAPHEVRDSNPTTISNAELIVTTADDPSLMSLPRPPTEACDHPVTFRNTLKQLRLDSFDAQARINQHQFAVVPDQLTSSCPSCRRATSSVQSKCCFCDKPTCDGCLQRCINCHGDFCSLCSFKLYDQRDDAAICLSCSSV